MLSQPRRNLYTSATIFDESKRLLSQSPSTDRQFSSQTKRGIWELHEMKKPSSRIGLIQYLARNIEDDSTRTSNNQHKSLVRSITTYVSTIFLNCKNYWKTAQIIQNPAVQTALRVPQYTSIKNVTNLPLSSLLPYISAD